ncbi:MAG: hypothetical protein IT463_09145 [Planctomycetes bacterium]|nr:hypothetical protein [Planctomycetota bacterium]
MDKVLQILSENKEKILFGGVLLATLLVALKASPLGAGIPAIEAEVRATSLQASGVNEAVANKAAERLVKPVDISPTPPDPKQISALFFDERDLFKPTKSNAWMLGQETFERLPPIQLALPGFPLLTDFDLPSGPGPGISRARGVVPRDTRVVSLADADTGEFND